MKHWIVRHPVAANRPLGLLATIALLSQLLFWTTPHPVQATNRICLSDELATSMTALPGGGTFATVTPPAGFDPKTASDADLTCYGLPPRPPDASGLAHWVATVGQVKTFVPVTPTDIHPGPTHFDAPANLEVHTGNSGGGITGYQNSNNWGGLVFATALQNSSYQNLQWKEVSASWNVPTVIPSAFADWNYTWVGLGGDAAYESGGTIVQAGTYEYGQNLPNPYTGFWYENYNPACDTPPNCPPSCTNSHPGDPLHCNQQALLLYDSQLLINPGQEANLDVRAVGSTAVYFFFMNLTMGRAGIFAVNYPTDKTGYDIVTNTGTWTTAEFIQEDAGDVTKVRHYPPFITRTFSETYMYGTYTNNTQQAFTYGDITSYNPTFIQACSTLPGCGTTVTPWAVPSGIDTTRGLFSICYNTKQTNCPTP